mmetsp:Transcript_44893/g.132590  ORF Transcript_44893/g.132590 Transcript_44893/m.132590 type:complete len:114 (-) Transcript_44893:3578-3919(-)
MAWTHTTRFLRGRGAALSSVDLQWTKLQLTDGESAFSPALNEPLPPLTAPSRAPHASHRASFAHGQARRAHTAARSLIPSRGAHPISHCSHRRSHSWLFTAGCSSRSPASDLR